MSRKLIIIILFGIFSGLLIGDSLEAKKKVYIYAWVVPSDVEYYAIKNNPKPDEVIILYWGSPWPVTPIEKAKIIKNFRRMANKTSFHLNYGFKFKAVNRELIKNGKIKTGLINENRTRL